MLKYNLTPRYYVIIYEKQPLRINAVLDKRGLNFQLLEDCLAGRSAVKGEL